MYEEGNVRAVLAIKYRISPKTDKYGRLGTQDMGLRKISSLALR